MYIQMMITKIDPGSAFMDVACDGGRWNVPPLPDPNCGPLDFDGPGADIISVLWF